MKTFIVPMFLVVRAADEDAADIQAADIQAAVYKTGTFLYQDEAIPTLEVPDQEEYHSVLDHWTREAA